MGDVKVVEVHCNGCGHETRHAVRAFHSTTRQEYEEELGRHCEIRETFAILECLGCQEMVARETGSHDGWGTSIAFYPPRISRRPPWWIGKLPKGIVPVLWEVYRALQANSSRLAMMGARTVVDLVMLDKVGDAGTFQVKLTQVEMQGYVGTKNREFLAAALDAGSAAAHRGLAPDKRALNHVMDIVENLLEAVYVLEKAAASLKKVTPPRPKQRRPRSTPLH